ncbi:hypothetical protein GRJ2_000099700 [Grus japonensis]|uniref:Reverse transcriptase n=1 Tax=Grus japonensis TaxID=30415 RepID=A0ABC9VT27_GRUJA
MLRGVLLPRGLIHRSQSLLTRAHTGVPACPVQQHRNSSDALAICQPRRITIAVIRMFPGTARLPPERVFQGPKGLGIAASETEQIEQLSTLPGLLEDPSVVGLLRVKEQQVPIATTAVHRRQYRTNRDSLVPIHKLIRQLESQGVISRTRSPFNSPIWPVRKSNGEWRLAVGYRGLNEDTTPINAARPDMLELQYELESKAAK